LGIEEENYENEKKKEDKKKLEQNIFENKKKFDKFLEKNYGVNN
jgi:hypothetical protein